MQIKILGSGPSTGVPMALGHWGNSKTNEDSIIDFNNPKNFRDRSSFFLQDNNKSLLVECGPEFRKQTMKYNIDKIENVFISHLHIDHCGGLWELEHVAKTFKNDINIFCNNETLMSIKERNSFLFNESVSKWIHFTTVIPYKIYNELTILECKHDTLQSIGFRYKDFVFTPDLNFLPEKSKQYMQNAKLWILQCNCLYESDYAKKIHTSLPRALKMIEELKPQKAILTHLSAEIDYDIVSKMLPENVSLAFDGMNIDLE
jgi:phosphoribosyl 1,2-cyclic phosphate phosphodiesterase